MSRLKYIGAAIVLLCCVLTSSAQNISNKGKEFWVGYGHHQFMENGSNTQNMVLYISVEALPVGMSYATVKVSIDSSAAIANPALWWSRTYHIPANTVIDIETFPAVSWTPGSNTATGPMPKSGSQDSRLFTDVPPAGTGGAGLFRKKGIHIEANIPVVAYAHIYGSTSSGATMLLPVEAWGFEYVSLNPNQSYANNCYSWSYVIAKEDNTYVEITPSVKTRANNITGLQPGVPTVIRLMKGQIYQVIGALDGSDANGNGGGSTGQHLSGTRFKSVTGPLSPTACRPIAVFSGSSRTANPITCGSGGGDNSNQQMFPAHAWGKKYLTSPFAGTPTSADATSMYRVSVLDPTTQVRRNGVLLTGLTNGNYYTYVSNTADKIESDKPVSVVQFLTGGNCIPGSYGDPSMVVLSPVEQGTTYTGFYRNNKESIQVNYVNIVVPNGGTGLSSLRIDGGTSFTRIYTHPADPNYTVVIKDFRPASKAQCIITGDSVFTAITYGLGNVEAYAYNAGSRLINLNAVSGINNFLDSVNGGTNHHNYTSANTPFKLSALLRYQATKIEWKFNELTPLPLTNISPNPGYFVMDPASNFYKGTVTISGIQYHKYEMPDTFRFTQAGVYNLPIVAHNPGINNCGGYEALTLNFNVYGPPPGNGGGPPPPYPKICVKDSVKLTGPANATFGPHSPGTPSLTLNMQQWFWIMPNGDTLKVRDTSLILPLGIHTIKFVGVTENGLLVGPRSFTYEIVPPPTVTLIANPDTLCIGQQVTFSQTSSYSGTTPINYFSWDLANGSPGTSNTWTNKNVTYPAYGTYNTWLVVGASPTCLSDTSKVTVVVNEQAHATITPPSGCLTGGVGQFQASSTAQGGTAITSYAWNFGDPSTGANNTSTLQNPSHTFSAPGVYRVILNIVTATGCTGADTIMVNANIKPELAWSSSANFDTVCITQAPFSLAFGTVTNGITGKPKYTGPGIDSAGLFNPMTAGAGTHTIVYTFTSDSGCVETIDTTITVSPRPAKPIVTSPVNYCQNDPATPLSATALPGHALTWYTNPSLTGGSTTAPTPSTAAPGTTKYYVTQISEGCESEADTITVNITPSIAGNTISADQTICAGTPTNTLVTVGTVSGGTNTYTYQWQSSTDGTNWTDIVGANAETYNAGNLMTTTSFRRVITSGLCGSTSNVITIVVVPGLGNNTISASHAVCEGVQPNLLTGSVPSGGDGTNNYQWQSSPDGVNWTNIAGATAQNYQPPVIATTTHYRRMRSSSVCSDISNVVIVTVNLNANGGITAVDPDICANEDGKITFTSSAGTAPFSITYTVTYPSGGSNTVTQTLVTSGTQFIVVPQGSAPGTYTITLNTITNSNGCVNNAGFNTVTITVTAMPVVSVNPVAPICQGTSATLTANGATTYTWNPGNITGNGITVTPAATQVYTVTGATNGCIGTATIEVVVSPRPAKPTVTTPVTYCQNAVATALVANGVAGNTITYYNNPGLTGGSTTAPVPSTSAAGTTTYYVTQTNSNGCESEAETITVTITPSVDNNTVSSSQSICAGSVPVITATTPTGGTGTYTYQWQSSADGTSWTDIAGATSANYTAVALTSTTHYRRIVNSGLCSNTSAAITVTVTPAITNNTIGTSHNVCEGIQPNPLTGSTPSGGSGTFGYQWLSSSSATGPWTIIAGATAVDYQAPILTTTTYYRRIVTSGVCTDTSAEASAVAITVIQNANGNIAAQDADICQYEAGNIVFTATAGTAPFTIDYSITNPAGSTTTTNVSANSGAVLNVVNTGSAAGTYTITLNSITNSNGCVRTGGFTPVTITVTATPVVSITPVTPVCLGSTVTLTASGATTYAWTSNTPGGTLSGTTGSSVTTTPVSAGTYNYSVTGTTNGCNSAPVAIDVVINPRPSAPTVTTPVDYCQLGAASPLTGSGEAGNTITWYDNAALTGGVTTAPTPSTNNGGTFTYYVTQTNSFGCESAPATITVNVAPGVGGNSIGTEQTICQGNAPSPLTNTGTLTGGNGTYSYQWQVSTDGTNWTNIAGATSANYTPGVLNDTTWYRRNVTSSLCGSVSNEVRINVFEGLGNYNITAAQTICEGTQPLELNGQQPSGSGPFTYTWEQSTDGGATWTAIASSNTEDYQPPVLNSTVRYRRKVTNGPCTATSNEVIITVNPLANGNITAPTAICEYQAASITFNATIGTGTFTIEYNITAPGGTVTASGPVSVTNGSTLNVIPTGSAAGVYTIMLTSITGSNGCARTTGLNSVSITVNPRPVVAINPVTAICEGESKAITATGASTYVWNLGSLTGSTINVTPAITTTYQVVGTSLGCESNPASVVLTVNPKPNASFTIADAEICLDETASFTSTSTIDSGSIAELTWDFDNSNVQTIPNTTSPLTQTYSTHRIYNVKLTAKSDKGCVSDVFTLPLSVNPLPVASFDPPAFVCMPNGVATFQNTTSIANGAPMTYQWSFGDPASGAANTSTATHGSHVYPDSSSYDIRLIAVSAQGCRDTADASFNTFFNKPVAKFGVTPDTLCQGIKNEFFDSSFAPGSTIETRLWTFGDGSTSSDDAPVKTYLHPGNYSVKLQVANAQGCTAEVSKNIVVYLQPVVDAGPGFIVPIGTTVTFNAQTNSGALNLLWSSPTGGVLNNPSILKPSYVADQDGVFVLTATGEGNCSATDTLTVKVLRPITIPNAFSPNGDGINDTWGIPNLADYPTAVIEVYNRYGQSVFKQFGYGKPWDGKLNGKELPVGTYYYIIEPKSGFPRVTGYVVIVR